MEAWTEVNLVPVRERDEALLAGPVGRLVHDDLAHAIETWFFFWEPELRLRLRWREPARAAEHARTLAALLDGWQADGTIAEWCEGAHGRPGETYTGEAEHYGEEAWPRVQKDWMNGSEVALALVRFGRAGQLSKPLDYHWQRHVHLFTNQLFGTWEAEIELCLRQALGYLRMLPTGPTEAAARLIAELNEAAGGRR